MDRKYPRAALTVAVSFALTACVGLGAPVVSIKQPKSDNGSACYQYETTGKSLDNSIYYAQCWRETYLKAAASHSRARTAAALVMLPIAALALYQSLTGAGSSKSVTALGIGGATVYGTSSFLTNKGAQISYLDGAQAMTCAIDAVTPERPLIAYRAELVTSLSNLLLNINAVTSLLLLLDGSDSNNKSLPQYIQATSLVAEGNNMFVRGWERIWRSDAAAMSLIEVVNGIVGQVAGQVVKQEPNLDSLLQTAGNLRGLAQSFGTPAATSSVARAESSPELSTHGVTPKGDGSWTIPVAGAKNQTMVTLTTQVTELKAAIDGVQAILYKVGAGSGTLDLTKCQPKQPADTFSVTPSEPNHVVKEGGSLAFVVDYPASSAFPTASVDSSAESYLEMDGPRPVEGKMKVTVTGKAATPASAPVTLTIRDPSGQMSRVYQIQVVKDAIAKK